MALAGAFAIATATRGAAQQTALRQDLRYLAEDMFERIRIDRKNIDAYDFSLAMARAQCDAAAHPGMSDAELARQEWCLRLNDLAPYRTGENRKVRVTAPEPDQGTRVVEIALQASPNARAMPQEFIARRIIHKPL